MGWLANGNRLNYSLVTWNVYINTSKRPWPWCFWDISGKHVPRPVRDIRLMYGTKSAPTPLVLFWLHRMRTEGMKVKLTYLFISSCILHSLMLVPRLQLNLKSLCQLEANEDSYSIRERYFEMKHFVALDKQI